MFEGIRDFIIQAAELKFNCFFLMPLIDAFPLRLREELEGAWEVRGGAPRGGQACEGRGRARGRCGAGAPGGAWGGKSVT